MEITNATTTIKDRKMGWQDSTADKSAANPDSEKL